MRFSSAVSMCHVRVHIIWHPLSLLGHYVGMCPCTATGQSLCDYTSLHYLHCTALHCTVLHYLHCTALHCTTCTALHCTSPRCSELNWSELHFTVPNCSAVHCTALLWCEYQWMQWCVMMRSLIAGDQLLNTALLHCSTVQYNHTTVQCSTIALQYSTVPLHYSTVQYQRTAVQCSTTTLQYSAVQDSNTLQKQHSTIQYYNTTVLVLLEMLIYWTLALMRWRI